MFCTGIDNELVIKRYRVKWIDGGEKEISLLPGNDMFGYKHIRTYTHLYELGWFRFDQFIALALRNGELHRIILADIGIVAYRVSLDHVDEGSQFKSDPSMKFCVIVCEEHKTVLRAYVER